MQFHLWPKRLGLRLKFTLLVTLLLLIVFSAQAFIIFTRNLETARTSLTNEAKTYTSLSTLQVGSSFNQYYAANHFRFGEIIQDILNSSNNTITRLQIYNTNGDQLFDSNELSRDERENVTYTTHEPKMGAADQTLLSQLQKIDPTFITSSQNPKQLGSIVYPFLDSYNTHQYSVRYYLSYDRIYQSLQTELTNVLIFVVLSLAISSALIILFVTQLTLKPISLLAKEAKKIEKGELTNPIQIMTGDELEDLAFSVTQMAQSLLSSQNSLRVDRDTIAAERNKLELVLSGVTDAVIAVDLNRQIIAFNKAAENLTRLKAEEVMGVSIDQVLNLYDETEPIPATKYCPINHDNYEGIVFNKLAVKVKSARQEFHANVMSGQIKDATTINLGCILTFHDVSREKQLEEMKLDFVSMAAHELRTPLTALKGYIYIFLRKYREQLNDEQQTYLDRISIATQRLEGLVENLLNVARIEKGALTIHLESIDWIKNIKGVVDDLRVQANDRKINIILSQPPLDLPQVYVDKFRINEVLLNLLSNAISYTDPGGSVTISTELTDKELITHIQDTGQGIPAEAIDHLFTKFFRVSGRLEQGSKGTGLGLYITKSIIDLHHGRIWVESKMGIGSLFSFALPLHPQKQVNILTPTTVDKYLASH